MHKRTFLQALALPLLSPSLSALAANEGQAASAASSGAVAASASAVGSPVSVEAVVRHHAVLVHAAYDDVLQAAKDLRKAVGAFTAQPDAPRLQAARQAWLQARDVYGQTEAFRFYGGPIDDESGPEGRLNAWPLDEAYIDGVKDRPGSGLINDRKVPITKASLTGHNERGGEENVATGWHAIEFLLWGQDFSDDGPGDRPPEDFVDGKAPNADRRRRYLLTVTDLLVDDLQSLVQAWAPGQRNYRRRFEQGGMESLRKIIVGLGSLSRGELAGERMEVALSTQDQEEEHSCFSDNTHRDIVANALGIENVWLGRHSRPDGTGLRGPSPADLLARRDEALAARVADQLALSVARARAIEPPFDREIIGGVDAPGRKRVQAVVDSLSAQSRLLVDAATALGITRLTLVQP